MYIIQSKFYLRFTMSQGSKPKLLSTDLSLIPQNLNFNHVKKNVPMIVMDFTRLTIGYCLAGSLRRLILFLL